VSNADIALDPSLARAEQRLLALARVTQKGLAVMGAVKEDGSSGSVEAFAKISRAVRLTITLEEKLDNALAARLAGYIPGIEKPSAEDAASAALGVPKDPYACLKEGRKGRARELMADVVDHEIPDPVEHDDLLDALDERLIYDVAYDSLDDLAIRDIVEHLCQDLKLKPDWGRWVGDGWKPNPPFYRPRSSLFKAPSRVPILEHDDEPDPLE
jgi:hypothetical protein